MPSSRPNPDCLNPPNGVDTRTEELLLMERTPVSSARATRRARAPLVVQIDPDNPYGVSLAMLIASASSVNGMIAATGPKTSSRAMRSSLVASISVHGYQNPGPSGTDPVKIGSISTNDATVVRWLADTSGPISVASSSGSPTRTPRVASTSNDTKRSYTPRCTRMRDRAQQSCPALPKTAYGAAAAARSRSASAKMTFADLPPSSRVTRLIAAAAPRITWRPTSVEPVNAILATSGCATRRSPAT